MPAVPPLLGLLLPSRCAACDAWGSGPWCEPCEAAIRWIGRDRCARCGCPAPAPAGDCRDCRGRRLAFDAACSAAVYDGPAREAVKAFKLLGERRAARALAVRMAVSAREARADAVTWVPATRRSESARGFNPAEELARPLARALRLPVRALLAKVRDTSDQAGLTKDRRRANLLGAFAAYGRIPRHVLLVDDIMTTGATAHECAAALKAVGARTVTVATFARAV